MSEKVRVALAWITQVLAENSIQYQVVGGLAAKIHGGTREVADIDLYINNADIEKLLPSITSYLSKPLEHYIGHGWDLEYLQLIYQSQKIEIGLANHTRIQSSNSGEWHELVIDLTSSVSKPYQGVKVSVMPVEQLVEYKRILNREVDQIDVAELSTLYALPF